MSLSALSSPQRTRDQKVLILDLDVHQGDGAAAILQEHPDIFTAPFTPKVTSPSVNNKAISMSPRGRTKMPTLLASSTLEKIQPNDYDCYSFKPVSTTQEDALGRLALTRGGLRQRNERVLQLHLQYDLPIVIFMGGGYAKPIERTVDAFEDLFTQATHYTV